MSKSEIPMSKSEIPISKFEKSTNNIQVRFYFKIGIYLVLVSWILDF